MTGAIVQAATVRGSDRSVAVKRSHGTMNEYRRYDRVPVDRSGANGHDAVMRGAGVSRRSGQGVRLNRRGRIVVAVACALLAWGVLSVMTPNHADSMPSATEVTSYTVRPGDTLWSYAESITPKGGDVSQNVDMLMRLNDLSTDVLQAGQRIVVPVR